MDAVLIGEYPQGSGAWRTLPNGARRRDYPFSELAVQLYPERFAYHVGVDRRDPEIDQQMAAVRSKPNSLCIRVVPLPATGEIEQFAQGAYEPIWAAAEKYDVPMFVGVPGNIDKLVPYLEKFPNAQVIMDHTATLYAGETPPVTDVAARFAEFDHVISLARYPNLSLKWCHAPDRISARGLSLQRPGAVRAPADRRVRSRARDVGQRLHAGPASPLVGAGAAPHAGLAHPVRAGSGVDLRQDHPHHPPLAAIAIEGLTDMTILIEKNVGVPMRDGTVLSADIYRPQTESRLPTLLQRTPYNKELPTLVNSSVNVLRVVQSGYAMVVQDTRGRFASQGTFIRSATKPTTARTPSPGQPPSRGQTAMSAWLAARTSAPRNGCRRPARQPPCEPPTPFITSADYYEGWTYQGGAFELGFSLTWTLGALALGELVRRIGQQAATMEQLHAHVRAVDDVASLFWRLPLTDMPALAELAPYYCDWLAHPTYDDYWRTIAPHERYEQVAAPALNIGGWYDLFLGGTLANYTGMRQRGAHRLRSTPAPDRRTLGARRFPRGVSGPRLRSASQRRRLRPDRGASALVRPLAEGRRQRRRARQARSDLRHGQRHVADRGRLAAAGHDVCALLPAQRRTRQHRARHGHAVARRAERRIGRRVPVRPTPASAYRWWCDLPTWSDGGRQQRPARPADRRDAERRAVLHVGAARRSLSK